MLTVTVDMKVMRQSGSKEGFLGVWAYSPRILKHKCAMIEPENDFRE